MFVGVKVGYCQATMLVVSSIQHNHGLNHGHLQQGLLVPVQLCQLLIPRYHVNVYACMPCIVAVFV